MDMVSLNLTNPICKSGGVSLPLPEQLLREINRDHPNIWKVADEVRSDCIKQGMRWADCDFLPHDMWWKVLSLHHPHLRMTPDLAFYVLQESYGLSFISQWRQTKRVYRFAESLRHALTDTALKGVIPSEVFKRMPERGMFIESPGLIDGNGERWDGFGVFLNTNLQGMPLICLMPLRRELNGSLSISYMSFALDMGYSIEEALNDCQNRTVEALKAYGINYELPEMKKTERFVAECLSLILYLCSEEPDISDDWMPLIPSGKKVKSGIRHFQADKLEVWNVGVRIGVALDMAKKCVKGVGDWQGGTHARPRGHIRRAHWHTFRTGKARTVPVVKWISPIRVNLGMDAVLPVSIHPVQ